MILHGVKKSNLGEFVCLIASVDVKCDGTAMVVDLAGRMYSIGLSDYQELTVCNKRGVKMWTLYQDI